MKLGRDFVETLTHVYISTNQLELESLVIIAARTQLLMRVISAVGAEAAIKGPSVVSVASARKFH